MERLRLPLGLWSAAIGAFLFPLAGGARAAAPARARLALPRDAEASAPGP